MKRISIVVVSVILCSMLVIGCGKKDTPKQIKLPTTVIKQTNSEDVAPQNPIGDSSLPKEPVDTVVQGEPEPFDPIVYEQENDDIQNLIDILEELIEQQE